MIKKINHVGFAVKDLNATLEFLKKTFGSKEVICKEFPDMGQTSCIVTIGESKYELMEPLGENGVVQSFIEKRGEGFHHISLLSDNLEMDSKMMEEAGVKFAMKFPDTIFTSPGTSGGVLYEVTTREV